MTKHPAFNFVSGYIRQQHSPSQVDYVSYSDSDILIIAGLGLSTWAQYKVYI